MSQLGLPLAVQGASDDDGDATRYVFASDSIEYSQLQSMESREREQLFSAISRWNLQTVKIIIAKYPNLITSSPSSLSESPSDENVVSPLAAAVAESCYEIVEWLIARGANVNTSDDDGNTLLHIARDRSIVRLLCECKCDVNRFNKSGVTAVFTYIQYECYECLKEILQNPRVDVMITAHIDKLNCFHIAAHVGDFKQLSILIKRRNGPTIDLNVADCHGRTVIHHAVMFNETNTSANKMNDCLRCLELLTANEAKVDVIDNKQANALHYICRVKLTSIEDASSSSSSSTIVSYLLRFGLSPNAADGDECTPLILACDTMNWEAVKLLLLAGGDLNLSCTPNTQITKSVYRRRASMNSINNISANLNSTDEATALDDYRITIDDNINEISANDLIGDDDDIRVKLYKYVRAVQTMTEASHCSTCLLTFNTPNRRVSKGMIDLRDRKNCRHCGRTICRNCGVKGVSSSVVFEKHLALVKDSKASNKSYFCKTCVLSLSA